jgi:tRNA-Thr(GGU) m(6)t(6)A37 methyltransferase TsaA
LGMVKSFQVFPVGMVQKKGRDAVIEIYPEYEAALSGLDQYSHLIVLCWFHENDAPEKRKTLQVHPRRNRANPLTGVFATRSPLRPNLVALFTCKLLSIQGTLIRVEKIDAFQGTPVIDIKPYVPRLDAVPEAKVPGWIDKQD